MLEIIIQGRGGQGAQTAGNLLARAFFADGKYVQTFSTYGGARRGGPVSSFIRVDDQPIRQRYPHVFFLQGETITVGDNRGIQHVKF